MNYNEIKCLANVRTKHPPPRMMPHKMFGFFNPMDSEIINK
jgi:hypothetical protein